MFSSQFDSNCGTLRKNVHLSSFLATTTIATTTTTYSTTTYSTTAVTSTVATMNVPVKMAPMVHLGGSLSLTTSNEISTIPTAYLTEETMITDPILFSTNTPIEVAKNKVFSRGFLWSLKCSDFQILKHVLISNPRLAPFYVILHVSNQLKCQMMKLKS